MTPWLGSPTSYASGYMSAHRTAADSQSFTCAFSSPPTYCTGFETRGSSGSRSGKIDGAVMLVQGSRVPFGATSRPGHASSRTCRRLLVVIPRLQYDNVVAVDEVDEPMLVADPP